MDKRRYLIIILSLTLLLVLYLISVSKGTHQAGSANQIGSADQSDSSLQKGEVDPQQFLPYYNQPELQTSQKLRDYKNYPYLQEIFEEIRIYDKSLLVDDFPENFYEKVVLNYYISEITNNEELLEYLFMENTPQHRDYLAVDDDEKFFDSGSVKRIVIKQVEAFIDIEEINQEFDILSDQVHINFPGYKTVEDIATWLKMPKELGGHERYKNMTLIHKKYQSLLDEQPLSELKALTKQLKTTKKMMIKINNLREQAGLLAIE